MIRTMSQLLIFILLFQNIAFAKKAADINHASGRNTDFGFNLFSIMHQDKDLYISEVWKIFERNFRIDLTKKQRLTLTKNFKDSLDKMKVFKSGEIYKVGYEENGSHEFTISDFNTSDKSIQVNGIKIKIDKNKNLSENILAIANLINKNNETKQSSQDFTKLLVPFFIQDSYAFGELIIKGLLLFLIGLIIIPILDIYTMANFVTDKFDEIYDLCLKKDVEILYENSKTKEAYEDALNFYDVKYIVNELGQTDQKNCLALELKLQSKSKYTDLQLGRICKAAKEAMICREQYEAQSKIKTSKESNPQFNKREDSKKTPSVLPQ